MKAIRRGMIGIYYGFPTENHNNFVMSLKNSENEFCKFFLFSIFSNNGRVACSVNNYEYNSVMELR